jgi:hypothetical protein
MGAKKKVAKAGAAAYAARNNPYVQRVVDDEELRANLWQAYESARAAAGRLSNGKSTTTQIFDDKKLQKDLREAAENLRDVGVALREAPKRSKPKKRGFPFGKVLVVGVVGAGLAVALSEGLRKKVLDALFGAEEEFEYTSVTTPAPGTGAQTPSSTTS